MCVRTSTSHIYFQNNLGTFLNLVTIAYVNIVDVDFDRNQYFLFLFESRYDGIENGQPPSLWHQKCSDLYVFYVISKGFGKI